MIPRKIEMVFEQACQGNKVERALNSPEEWILRYIRTDSYPFKYMLKAYTVLCVFLVRQRALQKAHCVRNNSHDLS